MTLLTLLLSSGDGMLASASGADETVNTYARLRVESLLPLGKDFAVEEELMTSEHDLNNNSSIPNRIRSFSPVQLNGDIF